MGKNLYLMAVSMSSYLNEIELFTILSKMIRKDIKVLPEFDVKTKSMESLIREVTQKNLDELFFIGLLEPILQVPSTSLVKLLDIDLTDVNPKVNLWPLVRVFFPLAKEPETKTKLMDSDGNSLNDSINAGRYIDLT